MPTLSVVLRGLFALSLLLTLSACDFARSDLEEEQMEDPPPGTGTPEGVCAAEIDGEPFEADVASAALDLEDDTLDLVCEEGDIQLLFRLYPNAFGAATLRLGGPSGRAQLRVGDETSVTNTVPGLEDIGEVVFDAYTRDRVVGTFRFTVPGFVEGDSLIHVTMGTFDIEIP